MTSQKIIERLKGADWYIVCKTNHELALVLNACLDANITWDDGVPAPKCYLICPPVSIGISSYYWGICWDDDLTQNGWGDSSNITNWFFEELRNE
jgi:hypothetical protein